uniref:Anaphase-promoting complex subunit 11 RING-H2 finger domain-containing protein n=1 Tax=Chenopodium quinoa TaxID=63459 RepID=A0A803KN74_CHEQI
MPHKFQPPNKQYRPTNTSIYHIGRCGRRIATVGKEEEEGEAAGLGFGRGWGIATTEEVKVVMRRSEQEDAAIDGLPQSGGGGSGCAVGMKCGLLFCVSAALMLGGKVGLGDNGWLLVGWQEAFGCGAAAVSSRLRVGRHHAATRLLVVANLQLACVAVDSTGVQHMCLQSGVRVKRMKVNILQWHAVASWTWDAQDETCGICRMAFDGCCPDCKLPGDDCPLSM